MNLGRSNHQQYDAGPCAPRRVSSLVLLAVVLVAACLGVTAAPASAAVFTVTDTADGGPGTLRDAFAQASASAQANEIVLESGATYALDDCAEGDLDYTRTDPLTITGNGAIIEQTCPGERVIETDGDLTVVGTTVAGGDQAGGLGGGIEADIADVALVQSSVVDNAASTGGGIAAIRVTLDRSTVAGNEATANGGGVWADQTISAVNSTIVGNTADTAGGGLAVVNTSVTLLYVTVAGNTSPRGANVQLQPGSDELISFGAVIAEPLGGGDDCELADGASATSQGSNFTSDASCELDVGTGDQAAAGDPALGPLGANGGPTETRVPDPGSPLIDGADCTAAPESVTEDQRGITRPQGPACDVGAVEVEVTPAADDTPAPTTGTPTAVPATPVTGATPRFTG